MLRKATVIAATLATTTAVAACGGSSPPKNAEASGKSAALKLAECMRTHGVSDFPDPSGGAFGIQSPAGGGGPVSVDGHTLNVRAPAFQRAMQTCQKYQPSGPAISSAQLASIKQSTLKMAECMRSHGVPNFPDPRVSTGPNGHGISVEIGGPGGPGGNDRLDPNSPSFTTAQQTCGMMRIGLNRKRSH
jgi:hypothetical protein